MSTDPSTAGDLHDPEATPAEVARRISLLLKNIHRDSRISVVSRTTSTTWTIEVSIVQHDEDLADETTREALLKQVAATAARFSDDASIPAADHQERDFRLSVVVHEDYWSMRQASGLDPHWRTMTPKAFLGMLHRGTRLFERSTDRTHSVVSIGKDRFETETSDDGTKMRWPIPRAAAIRRSGSVIRLARGRTNDPDAFTMFEIEEV